MKNLPNILTVSRLFMLPVIITLLVMKEWGAAAMWGALLIYVLACITDFLDGWLARKYNQTSAFGTFLDPISDKIFVAAMILTFAGTGLIYGLWLLPAILILAREFMVSGMREYLGPKNIQLPVTALAKWKTTTQMLAMGLFIVAPALQPSGVWVAHLALTLAALITIMTGWDYLKAGLDHMKKMS